MISNIKIKGGLLSKLFGNVNIEFTDALNILYGENGCGKSALFKTIADYCLIEHHIGSSKFPIWYDENYQVTRHYTKLSSFECDWDGSSCFMYSGIDIQDNHSNLAYEMSTGKRVPELEYSFMSFNISTKMLNFINKFIHLKEIRFDYLYKINIYFFNK